MTAASSRNLDKPRRVYRDVATEPRDSGFAVTLDGRAARTPAGALLVLPTSASADLVAGEWAGQVEVVDFGRMPATRLAFSALDGGRSGRAACVEEAARYAGSDLLCYFADGPQALAVEQVKHWGPMLDWAETDLGLRFTRTLGVMHAPQPGETVLKARALAEALDDFALSGLAFAIALLGSVVLAFALQRGQLTGDAAFDLSRLDEDFQVRRWGVDAEAATRAADMRAQAQTLERWFAALSGRVAPPDRAP